MTRNTKKQHDQTGNIITLRPLSSLLVRVSPLAVPYSSIQVWLVTMKNILSTFTLPQCFLYICCFVSLRSIALSPKQCCLLSINLINNIMGITNNMTSHNRDMTQLLNMLKIYYLKIHLN